MKWIKLFEGFDEIENIVIVGGGISSLYAAYLIKKRFPKVKYTIIEKDSNCGGRVTMDEIDGISVPTGAHFTRVDKDKILNKLLKELDIELDTYNLDIDFTFKSSNVKSMISKLKENYTKFDRSKFTFSEFAKKILGKDYVNFVEKGFTY